MKIYLLSYDLKKPGQDYAILFEELKSADKWWHYLQSTWLLASNLSFDIWNQKIRSKIDSNDQFLLIELNSGIRYDGWLPKEAWNWVRGNFEQWIGPPTFR